MALSRLEIPSEKELDLSWATPGTTESAVERYVARRADVVFSAAYLEGTTFTLSEVNTLLDGTVPGEKTAREIDDVVQLAQATETLATWVQDGEFALSPEKQTR